MQRKIELSRRRSFGLAVRRVNYAKAINYVVCLGWLECRLIVFKASANRSSEPAMQAIQPVPEAA